MFNLLDTEDLCRQLLLALGRDPTEEGLRDTPRRIANFWEEFLNREQVRWTTFEAVEVNQLVVVKGIEGWSMCEHHLMPFSFTADVGYLTNKKVIGLSKIPRIVDWVARDLQLQERMTNQIADIMEEVVEPMGVAVVVRGQHTCMQARGIRAREAEMVTSCLRGVLLANQSAKDEFFQLCERR